MSEEPRPEGDTPPDAEPAAPATSPTPAGTGETPAESGTVEPDAAAEDATSTDESPAAPARKTTPRKTTAKATPARKTAPATATPATAEPTDTPDAAPAKKTTARKAPAKKAAAAKTSSAAEAGSPEAPPAKKSAPAKKAAPTKKAAPAKKAVPTKKAAPATKAASTTQATALPVTDADESAAASVTSLDSPPAVTTPTGPEAVAAPTDVAASAAPASYYPAQPTGVPVAPPAAVTGVFYPQHATQPPPTFAFFEERWPGPTKLGGLPMPLAVLAGALAFAVFVPLNRPAVGIGWFLGGLVAAIAVGVVAWRSDARLSTTDRVFRAVWGVSALALLSVLAFRNAWWLVTFCLLGAIGCAMLAVAGGRSIRAIAFSAVAVPVAAFRAMPWLRQHLERPARADEAPPRHVGRLVWSIVATVILLLIFGALFASADAAFADVLSHLVPSIDGGTVFQWVFLFAAGALATLAGAYLVSAPADLSGMHTPAPGRLRRLDWALPIGALVVLFLGFVAVQVTVLFGGRDHVLKTAGLSYAEYARTGFWQLTWATVLTLLIILAIGRWAVRDQPADRLYMRILLGALSTLSLVIVASALYRMYTYQQAYSFTGERIFVMGFELVLGAVFVMVIVAGAVWNGSWIPRATVAALVVLLLSLAVMNPEGYAAKRNVDRFTATGKIDLYYLAALSADATAQLAKLPNEQRRCALSKIDNELRDPDPWYAWNLGRERARDVLRDLGKGASGNCKGASQYDYPTGR